MIYLILSTSTSKGIINFPSESFEKPMKSGVFILNNVAKQDIKIINFRGGKKKHEIETYPFCISGSNDVTEVI